MTEWNAVEKKKILLLNGSPRKGASSTMLVSNAFINGIKSEIDCDVEILHLSDLNITPCTGCLSCWGRTEGECVIKNDDIPAVKKKIEECDVFIESFPLYFFGMPGTVKVFCDRMLSMLCTYKGQNPPKNGESLHGIRNPSNKKFVIISSCAYTQSESIFDSLHRQFDCICGKSNYLSIECPQLFTLAKTDSEARKNRYLQKFFNAGKSFAKNGTVSSEELSALSKPPFSEETYKVLLNGFWQSQKDKNN